MSKHINIPFVLSIAEARVQQDLGQTRYVARLFIRIDKVIYRLKGVKTYWSRSGALCQDYGTHGAEVSTHFPGWVFHVSAYLRNRWPKYFIWLGL